MVRNVGILLVLVRMSAGMTRAGNWIELWGLERRFILSCIIIVEVLAKRLTTGKKAINTTFGIKLEHDALDFSYAIIIIMDLTKTNC